MSGRCVIVNDLMQQRYVYWCTESVGDNFDDRFNLQLQISPLNVSSVVSHPLLHGPNY